MILRPAIFLWSLSIVVLSLPARSDRLSIDIVEAAGNSTEPSSLATTCPPCEELFTRLGTSSEGGRVQNTDVYERGEPKSGTTMMFEWAVEALNHTCTQLEATFGENSCRTEKSLGDVDGGDTRERFGAYALIFEPHLSTGDGRAKCSCDTVDRVQVYLKKSRKHELPVSSSCRWWHRNRIPLLSDGCKTVNGKPVQNYADLWSCMQESPCEIIRDEWIQFVPMRDPRAVAVSTYYYARVHPSSHLIENHYPAFDHTLDETVLDILESVCQWTAIRHVLFNGFMSNTSTVFWYDDAIANPSEWHYRWTHMVGLRLPTSWVKDMSVTAAMSMTKGVNIHPGGAEKSVHRTWKEEVSPEIWDDMDDVLRQWLPPVLLARFGV